MVQVYSPAVQATVYKRIRRFSSGSPRFEGGPSKVDLTPFLSDTSVVTTSKDIRNPKGSWLISMADRVFDVPNGVADSLYGFIEPMDYIEIRFARSPELYGATLPVIMRGFVRNVRRSRTVATDGTPQRRITLSGDDFGMVGELVRIFLRSDYEDGNNYLSSLRLLLRNGLSAAPLAPKDFMTGCVQMLNLWLAALGDSAADGSFLPTIQAALSVTAGLTWLGSPTAQLYEGDIWSLITQWADQPWNEVFIEDQDSMLGGDTHNAPTLIFRPCPFVGLDGKSLLGVPVPRCSTKISPSGSVPQAGPAPASEDADLVLTPDDIVSDDLVRSDSAVWNYFWVPPGAATLGSPELVTVEALDAGQVIDQDGPNNSPDLYGLRMLSQQSAMLADGGYVLAAVRDTDISGKQTRFRDWYSDRRDQLKAMNRDNVVFERGTISAKGNENLRAGRYVTVADDGGLRPQFYIYGVSHTFLPLRSYSTAATVERGTNFLERVKAEKSAYFAEGATGAYG